MAWAPHVIDRDDLVRTVGEQGVDGGVTVAVTGPPGIGKSHLLDELASGARSSQRRVVLVRAHEPEQRLPFAGLATLYAQVASDTVLGRLGTDQRSLLEAALGGTHPIGHELAIGSAVLALFGAAIADAPVLLLVDDVQWLDPPSRQAIFFALRRLEDDPIVAVFASSDTTSLPHGAAVVELGGVDLATATSLLSARAPVAEHVARRCWEATGGNPLALHEMARRLDDRHLSGVTPVPWQQVVPRHLVDAATERLDHLDADARTAMLVLAVVSGASIDVGLEAFGLRRIHLRAAIDAGLVTDAPRPVVAHSTCAAAVIAAAPTERVRTVHARLARVVRDPDEAAWHLSAAADGPDDVAATHLADVAERARRRGMPTAAAAAFERAAELSGARTSAHRWALDAATAWWYAARPERVIAVLEPVLADPTLDPSLRALVALRLGTARSWLTSPSDGAQAMLDHAVSNERVDPAGATRLLYASTASAALAADFRTAAEAAERAGSLVDAGTDPIGATIAAAVRGFVTLVRGAARDGDADVATLTGLATLPIDRLADEQLDLVQFVVFGLHVLGRLDEASRLATELRRAARARGLVSLMVYASGLLGEIERRRGDWAMAERWASDVSTTLSVEPFSHGEFGDAVCARLWAHQGRPDVDEIVAPLVEQAQRHHLGFVLAVARSALAASALALGDHERAWHHLDLTDRDIRRAGGLDPGVLWIDLDALDVMLALGRHADALRLVRERRATASSPSGAWSAAVADLGRCLLVARGHLTGEPMHGARSPADVVAAFDALGAPFEAARARLLLAEAELVPQDDRDDVVQRALDTFRQVGAGPWERRADTLLSGRAPSAPGPTAPHERLSSAELRVGLTVASGCSNAEAAAELYLSQRTVEAHLRAIFRKLGVRNRTEMAMRLQTLHTPGSPTTIGGK